MADRPVPRWRRGAPVAVRRSRALAGRSLLLAGLALALRAAAGPLQGRARGRPARSPGCFAAQLGGVPRVRRTARRAVQQAERQAEPQAASFTEAERETRDAKLKADAEVLAFETMKFNMAWTKMKEAEENKSPQFEVLRKEVEAQGQIVEKLGGSLPAEMLTLEEAAAKAARLRKDLSFDKLMSMSNEERWIVAQGLGPAFPISLVLSYTLYWTLNVPIIAYAYFTTVVSGQATMGLVMAGAYATSIPFKPLIYVGAMLGTPWTAENVMPLIGKFFNFFKLPDESDFDRL